MSDIRKLIQEKFGYTADIKDENLHEDPEKRQGRGTGNASYLPIEGFRDVVKALMSATTSEQDAELENIVDFTALQRLATRHDMGKVMINNLDNIQQQLKQPKGKQDRKVILDAWKNIKDNIPYWCLGLLPHHAKEPLPEDEKAALMNLRELMDEFNKHAEKIGKKLASATEHASRDTAAKDNLEKVRKEHKMIEAGSEKKLSKGTEIEVKPK